MTETLARVTNLRTGRGTSRSFDSAEKAAGNLLLLLRADGWTEDPDDTKRRLLVGESITHNGRAYSLSMA